MYRITEVLQQRPACSRPRLMEEAGIERSNKLECELCKAEGAGILIAEDDDGQLSFFGMAEF